MTARTIGNVTYLRDDDMPFTTLTNGSEISSCGKYFVAPQSPGRQQWDAWHLATPQAESLGTFDSVVDAKRVCREDRNRRGMERSA